MQIGFIGLGIMGANMATNLLKAGYSVQVFNRTIEKAEPLKPYGAQVADTPADVAHNADILLTMLGDPEAVKAMAYGPSGFLSHLKPESVWVDCTTVDPKFAKQMANEASKQEISYLDAPVLGSKGPAAQGDLVFLVGGEAAAVERVKPLLMVMGKAVQHLGEVSKGAAMKMVFNHQLGHAMAAFSEALNLAGKLGLDEEQVMDNLLETPVVPAFLKGKKAKLKAADYQPEFPLRWMQKDLHLAAKTAYEHDAPAFLANTAKEMYQLAKQKGYADQDFSAIYALWKELRDEQA